jgi:hypothetical protein
MATKSKTQTKDIIKETPKDVPAKAAETSTKIKNKFAKWAMGWSAGALVALFLVPILDLVLAAFALYLGIRGLKDYNKDPSIGGKTGAIVAIVVSSIILLLSIFQIIGMMIPKRPYYYY